MLVDLVQTQTRDGLRLDGILLAPPSGAGPELPLDVCCLVHGTGGSFYTSTLFDSFTERLLQLGVAVLRVNTRGHDGISTASTPRGGSRQGAAYEVLDDCRHDLAAWVEFLRGRGLPRIALIGHSSGAVKSLYALALDADLPVTALVALSPPRLSYSWYCQSAQGAEFLKTYQAADELVQAGQPAKLIEVQIPLPYAITAAGYVEKYGPDERYNFLNFVTGVRCPTLLTFGSAEVAGNMAFQELPDLLRGIAAKHRQLHVEVIEGADHFYMGLRQEIVARVEGWLRKAIR